MIGIISIISFYLHESDFNSLEKLERYLNTLNIQNVHFVENRGSNARRYTICWHHIQVSSIEERVLTIS